MRRIKKAAALLAIATLAGSTSAVATSATAAPPATSDELPRAGQAPDLLAPNGLRGGKVDLNEIRLVFAGGYGGDWIRRADMKLVRTIAGVNFYKVRGRLYVDRDGDQVIDAGAVYVPKTGLVLADWNCDGRGDQMLFNMRPRPEGSWGDLLKRIRAEASSSR